ncbi:hypothetical protein VB773_03065 [Haloarculaceae archaeon H-GB2-1]|nr:hypothetical protein [Haloarculaceae archaeon H-GB1-1]MEA5388606.1 hypothetical protein [Haloarculaceae archaeon H-GB11]MEA5406660.1 hypothetical protein [Haloarculaceae archaeon H-GB2-1]
MSATPPDADDDAYGGVFGAFPYALRASESWLFKLYAVVGGVLAGLFTLLFAFSLVVLVASTLGGRGGTFTFSRAFLLLIALFVVGPTAAPILLVARRLRRGESDDGYESAMAISGFLFLGSLYLGLLASIPPAQQRPVSGVLAPVVHTLYGLPPLAGLVPPLLAAALLLVVHRRLS